MTLTIDKIQQAYAENERLRREVMSAAVNIRPARIEIPKLALPADFNLRFQNLDKVVSQALAPFNATMNRLVAEAVAPLSVRIDELMRNVAAPFAIQAQRIFEQYAARVAAPLQAFFRRMPYVMADHALEAALEGDHQAVARFAKRCLKMPVTQSKVDAVVMALFEQTWTEVPGNEVMDHIRARAQYWYRNGGKALWEHKVNGLSVISLDSPIRGNETLVVADRVSLPDDPIDGLCFQLDDREVVQRVAARLSDEERRIFLRRTTESSWSDAARAEGFPAEVGDYLRKKLSRWVDQGVISHPRGDQDLWHA